MRKLFLLLTLLLILVGPCLAQGVFIPSGFTPVKYQVEELSANLFNDNTLLVVSGKIRNLSGQPVRGAVIVYLKNNSDEVVQAFDGEVNNNSPFNHGADGFFELSANIAGYPKAHNVAVEFVPR